MFSLVLILFEHTTLYSFWQYEVFLNKNLLTEKNSKVNLKGQYKLNFQIFKTKSN